VIIRVNVLSGEHQSEMEGFPRRALHLITAFRKTLTVQAECRRLFVDPTVE